MTSACTRCGAVHWAAKGCECGAPTYDPAPGDTVTVRRWIQPSRGPGDPARELSVEFTGVIKGIRGDLIDMDEAEGGFFCPRWVFCGGDGRGSSWYLVTEIEATS